MKIITLGSRSRDLIQKGVEKLADATKVTLGPRGRTVILKRLGGVPVATKDGVSIAKEIEDEDPTINAGIEIVRNVAELVDDEVGDSTTTSIILSQKLLTTANSLINSTDNVVEIKDEITSLAEEVCDIIDKLSIKIDNQSQLTAVATISTNGNLAIGEIVGKTVWDTGKDGSVSAEPGIGDDIVVVKSNGYEINRGLINEVFINNHKAKETILHDPVILIVEGQISSSEPFLEILNQVADSNSPLLLVAQDISGEALDTLVANNTKGNISICPVRSPGFNETKMDYLTDLASVTGATIINKELSNIEAKALGSAKKVIVNKFKTSIIPVDKAKEAILSRVDLLKMQLENEFSNFKQSQIHLRIASLQSKAATIYVGGISKIEKDEKLDRVIDGINAAKSALEEGVIIGGGMSFYHTSMILSETINPSTSSQKKAFKIINTAIKSPSIQILENAGLDSKLILKKINKSTLNNVGFNVNKSALEDFLETNILDSAKAMKVALRAAVSITGTLLTTEGSVIEKQNINFL